MLGRRGLVRRSWSGGRANSLDARIRPDGRIRLGRRGERIAEKLLRRAGLIVLARNWRGGGGELDLALLDGNTLVFVEVKTRRTESDDARHPVARHPVTVAQRKRNRQAAHAFRRRYGVPELGVRYDLVTVTLGATKTLGATGQTRWHRDYQRNVELQEQR